MSKEENIRVLIRVKPSDVQLNPASANQPGSEPVVLCHLPTKQVQIKDEKAPEGKLLFAYDEVMPSTCKQAEVFQYCTPLLDTLMSGISATIFCYGQSGSGKSHTMEGNMDAIIGMTPGAPGWDSNAGLLPAAIHYIFDKINSDTTVGPAGKPNTYLVHCVYIEIYNENVYDLLNEEKVLQVGEIKEKDASGAPAGFILRDATDIPVKTPHEAIELVKRGGLKRRSSSTSLNSRSSRSHAIFVTYVESCQWLDEKTSVIRKSRLNLVDLAGSERLSQSKVEGVHKREAANINQSLFALGRCISALVRAQKGETGEHIPFRTSKLTMLLKDSLAGSAKTLMIGCVRVEDRYRETSVSTLRFAEKLKSIKNKPIVNEDPRDSMLRKLQEQVEQMKAQLQNAASGGLGGGLGVGGGIGLGIPGDPLSASGASNFIITAGAADPRSFLTKYLSLAKAAGASIAPPSQALATTAESSGAPVVRRPPRRRAMSASAIDLSALALQATAAAAQLEEQAKAMDEPGGLAVTVTDMETGQTTVATQRPSLSFNPASTNVSSQQNLPSPASAAQAAFRRTQTTPNGAPTPSSQPPNLPPLQIASTPSAIASAASPGSDTTETDSIDDNASDSGAPKSSGAGKAISRARSLTATNKPNSITPSPNNSQAAIRSQVANQAAAAAAARAKKKPSLSKPGGGSLIQAARPVTPSSAGDSQSQPPLSRPSSISSQSSQTSQTSQSHMSAVSSSPPINAWAESKEESKAPAPLSLAAQSQPQAQSKSPSNPLAAYVPSVPVNPSSRAATFLNSRFSLNDVFAKAAFQGAVKQSAAVNPPQKPGITRPIADLPPGMDFSLPFPPDLDKEEIIKFHLMLRTKGRMGHYDEEEYNDEEQLAELKMPKEKRNVAQQQQQQLSQQPPLSPAASGREVKSPSHGDEKNSDANQSTAHSALGSPRSAQSPTVSVTLTSTGLLIPNPAGSAASSTGLQSDVRANQVPDMFRASGAVAPSAGSRFSGLSSFGLLTAEVDRLEETLHQLESSVLSQRPSLTGQQYLRHQNECQLFKNAIQNLKEKLRVVAKAKDGEREKDKESIRSPTKASAATATNGFVLNEDFLPRSLSSPPSKSLGPHVPGVPQSSAFTDVPPAFRQSQVSLYLFLCSCVERLQNQAIQMRIQLEQSKRIAEVSRTQNALVKQQTAKLATPKKTSNQYNIGLKFSP